MNPFRAASPAAASHPAAPHARRCTIVAPGPAPPAVLRETRARGQAPGGRYRLAKNCYPSAKIGK